MPTAGWAICRDVCKALLQVSLKASLEDLFRSCPAFAIRMACKGQRSQPNPVKPCQGCTVQFDHCSGMFRARMGYPAEPDATSNTAAPMEERLRLVAVFPFARKKLTWKVRKIRPSENRESSQLAKTYTHTRTECNDRYEGAHTHTRFFVSFIIWYYMILPWISMNVHTHTQSICLQSLHVILYDCMYLYWHIHIILSDLWANSCPQSCLHGFLWCCLPIGQVFGGSSH